MKEKKINGATKPPHPGPLPQRRRGERDARVRRVAWERVTKIDDLLRAGKYPNCVMMAREFGVSVRTVKRDIEFMVERHNLPIEYDQKRWGYFYSKPVEGFPKAPSRPANSGHRHRRHTQQPSGMIKERRGVGPSDLTQAFILQRNLQRILQRPS